jgi:hypothetical protein
MAILTKKSFANQCEIETKYLSVDISRGKVVVNADGMIDTTEPKNQIYIQKKLMGKEPPQLSSPEPTKPKIEKISVPRGNVAPQQPKASMQLPEGITEGEVNTALQMIEGMDYQQLEMLYKYLQGEKLKTDIEKNKIEIEKKMGVVVPSEPLIPIVKQHNHFILQEQKNADEELLLAMAHKYDIAPSDTAYLRGEWIRLRNDAVTKATNLTVKAIVDVINDYSEKRGVGQRM